MPQSARCSCAKRPRGGVDSMWVCCMAWCALGSAPAHHAGCTWHCRRPPPFHLSMQNVHTPPCMHATLPTSSACWHIMHWPRPPHATCLLAPPHLPHAPSLLAPPRPPHATCLLAPPHPPVFFYHAITLWSHHSPCNHTVVTPLPMCAQVMDAGVADYDKRTPIHLAAAEGHLAVVQVRGV